jgi:hypothetical protein
MKLLAGLYSEWKRSWLQLRPSHPQRTKIDLLRIDQEQAAFPSSVFKGLQKPLSAQIQSN